ncbi:class I SAM-dependent methyltransferase [Providencia rettgeri]|uniref:class I SAM-dependent methyltransferase n=1 Tax=Providencia sp. PROV182 TaxID=2949885 RepID=UPI00234AA2BA|nr:class I SAM-dependent methyltransferase [Providencia sp. PROV182]
MNYIVNGVTIRSENAAKPHTMPSGYLCNYIEQRAESGRALDFGCGKLRYSEQLINKFDEVTFLDSKKQLERIQIIRGVKTTVTEYVSKNYKKANAISFEELEKNSTQYDFILCSNVLSAIPCKLTIDKVLSNIKILLNENGEALIVNQYKSSYFKKYESGIRHLYGYIYKNAHNSFYYGLLNEDIVANICIENGLSVIDSWTNAGSSYVIVAR